MTWKRLVYSSFRCLDKTVWKQLGDIVNVFEFVFYIFAVLYPGPKVENRVYRAHIQGLRGSGQQKHLKYLMLARLDGQNDSIDKPSLVVVVW